MGKCRYCNNNVIDYDKKDSAFCKDACEDNYNKFILFENRNKNKFKILILIYLLFIFLGITMSIFKILVGNILLISGLCGLGVSLFIFPFGIGEIFEYIGLKNSILIIRIISSLLIVICYIIFLSAYF